MASVLMEMLGLGEAEAAALLEASGGSVEMAMNLHFGGDGGTAPQTSSFEKPFDWYTLVWPAIEPVPASWLEQDLHFSSDKDSKIGLVQKKNGPCGILSIIQCYILVELLKIGKVDVDKTPSDEIVVKALTGALLSCAKKNANPGHVVLCKWHDVPGGTVDEEKVACGALFDVISQNLERYTSEGGVVLLLYSAVLTRGVGAVRKDIDTDAGEPPLVLPPFHICTSDMIGLFLQGAAGGNTSSYTVTGEKQDWDTPVGLLTLQELEQGVPLADTLKSPPYPVWILHGGDHFTVAFSPTLDLPQGNDAEFPLYHWNGLPPAGPRLAKLFLKTPRGPAKPAPEKHKETYRKPKKGTIDDIVQASEEDKKARPGKYKTWKFEVVMAVDDPDIKDKTELEEEEREEKVYHLHPPPPGPWRCATCYHNRYKTMCFGVNSDTPTCQHCGRRKEEALWSFWLHYDEMTPSVRRLADRMFAPKVHLVFDTKWPGAVVTCEGKTPSL